MVSNSEISNFLIRLSIKTVQVQISVMTDLYSQNPILRFLLLLHFLPGHRPLALLSI